MIVARNDSPFLLTPLHRQSCRDLVCLLFMLATGHRLRGELRRAGVADADLIRAELRRREWEAGR